MGRKQPFDDLRLRSVFSGAVVYRNRGDLTSVPTFEKHINVDVEASVARELKHWSYKH